MLICLGNFQDMETGGTLITNPREVRRAYQDSFTEFLFSCQRMCAGLDIDYVLATTDQPVGTFVQDHLGRRRRRGR